MLGTLNGALEVREISLGTEDITATVRGVNEIVDRIPVLTKIDIAYSLRIPAAVRDKVDRALQTHQAKCPTACTLKNAIAISWTADIVEL